MNMGPYWGEPKWLLQNCHEKCIFKRVKCILKETSVKEKEDEVQLLYWNAQSNSAFLLFFNLFFFFSPACFMKQWSSYSRCRRTSVKRGGCRCSDTYLCFVWLERATRKRSISGVQRCPWPGIYFINILSLPSDREFSKPGKHSLFCNLVSTSLYRRLFVWFS